MTASMSRVVLMLGFGVMLAESTMAAPEKIPNDKVIHPLMKGVAAPQLIQESRVNPVYPDQWLKLHLGAVVILQGVVEKSGIVRDIKPLKTDLRVEESCSKDRRIQETRRAAIRDQRLVLQPRRFLERRRSRRRQRVTSSSRQPKQSCNGGTVRPR